MPFRLIQDRRAYQKAYHASNSARIRAKDRTYCALTAEEQRAKYRQYYLVNGDDVLARRRKKYADDSIHRERILASNRRSYHRRKEARHGTA